MTMRDCIDSVIRAAGGAIDARQAMDILDAVNSHRDRLAAEGRLAGDELRQRASVEADRAQRAAALRRRHAALTIVARDRVDRWLDELIGQGLAPDKAVLAVLEGTTKNLTGARRSVAATQMAFESRYLAPLMAAIAKERPHLERMLSEPLIPNAGRRTARDALVRDLARELHQVEGRATDNADAHFLADRMRHLLEVARQDLNRAGADIGRLDGYAPHSHDDWKVGAVSEDDWIDAVLPHLDVERSFPELLDPGEIRDVLRQIYRNVVSGRYDHPTARERGEGTGPPNLARSLAQHRVLHFKSADDWLAYQDRFGHGDAVTAVVGHLRRAARMAGQMEILGPNPEALFRSVLGEQQRRMHGRPERELRRLSIDRDGDITGVAAVWRQVTGYASTAVDQRGAHTAGGIRNVQSMAKLGQALISSVSDLVTNIANMSYRGRPLVASWGDAIAGYVEGRGAGQRREITYLLGEGFEGVLDSVISPYAAIDGPPGAISKLMTRFFRLSGLTLWTDTGKAVAARVLAADFGRLADTTLLHLPAGYRRVLAQHGIGRREWELLRETAWTGENGNRYVTPDRIERLADDQIDYLIETEIAAARERFSLRGRPKGAAARTSLTPAQQRQFDAWLDRRRQETRLELELSWRRLIADEGRFAVIGGYDPSVDRLRTGGQPAGTYAGEVIRFVMQFKGFPLGFTRRVLGRARYGGGGRAHVGHLLAGLFVAGYAAMTAKDMLRGYDPRDPTRWNSLIAAALQSGGLGIYGDFLFGEANRFGGGVLATLAGPSVSTAAELVGMTQQLRDGEPRAGRWLNLVTGNTPFLNLFYVRPALDFLFLNSLRESLSPGTLRRADQRRRRDYGQQRLWRATL